MLGSADHARDREDPLRDQGRVHLARNVAIDAYSLPTRGGQAPIELLDPRHLRRELELPQTLNVCGTHPVPVLGDQVCITSPHFSPDAMRQRRIGGIPLSHEVPTLPRISKRVEVLLGGQTAFPLRCFGRTSDPRKPHSASPPEFCAQHLCRDDSKSKSAGAHPLGCHAVRHRCLTNDLTGAAALTSCNEQPSTRQRPPARRGR